MWDLEVLLDDQTAVTADLRFIGDDALVRQPFPPTGAAHADTGTNSEHHAKRAKYA